MKNKMMRAASVLMVAVLLSTCAISGTFAKYVSSATGSDQARIAYWGFGMDGTPLAITGLFSNTYDNVASTGDDVVAPGTANAVPFTFKYTSNTKATAPEVAYDFTVDVTIKDMTGTTTYADLDAADRPFKVLDENANFVWTLEDAKGVSNEFQTVKELVAAIKALSGEADGTCRYNPGKLPATFAGAEGAPNGTQECTIGWKWYIDETATNDSVANEAYNKNEMDTAMGNATDLANIQIIIQVTATQVD